MKQFVLDYLAAQFSLSDRFVCHQRGSGDNDLLITLADHAKIAICIVNRSIRLSEIRQRYEANTRRRIHTLFIVDGRMVPDHADEVNPPQWMSALHTLTMGRVYAYWCDGREVTIRPLHMEWRWGGSPRGVEYGDSVEVHSLRPERLHAATRDIDGDFAVAVFGEGAFWKQRSEDGEAAFDYSWRNWSFGGARHSTASEDGNAGWTPWEEFQRHYGSTGSDERWQRSEQSPRSPRPNHNTARHYAILGVPLTASMEEVKQAYRRMARAYHPDLHPDEVDEYTAKMAEVNMAFEAIMNARR
ncbi:MAG: DnaJ domain-containing protein [Anaerolineae bacterium]|nr:DnaJ domain-containing protein [Anaerolineae bacterium]